MADTYRFFKHNNHANFPQLDRFILVFLNQQETIFFYFYLSPIMVYFVLDFGFGVNTCLVLAKCYF